jgi:hypothetical protein
MNHNGIELSGTVFDMSCKQMPARPLSQTGALVDRVINDCAAYITQAVVPMATASQEDAARV